MLESKIIGAPEMKLPDFLESQQYNRGGTFIVDCVCVGDFAELPLRSTDPRILKWTERENRLLVSFDKRSLPGHLADHLAAVGHSPGIFLVRRRASFKEVIEFLAVAAYASAPHEWQDTIYYIP